METIWRTFSAKSVGKSKCKICGKTIKQTFTQDFEEYEPIPVTPGLLKEIFERTEHICETCQKHLDN